MTKKEEKEKLNKQLEKDKNEIMKIIRKEDIY